LRRDWITLTAIIAYTGYLSYAVLRMLGSDSSTRERIALIAGWAVFLAVALFVVCLVAFKKGDLIYATLERFSSTVQGWRPWVRGLVYLGLLALPVLLTHAHLSRGVMENNRFRLAILFPLFVFTAQFWPLRKPAGFPGRFLVTILAGAYAFLAADDLKFVVDYPFSLSWSEGNRFYDYSLIFGKSLYQYDGELVVPYYSPGRYALWGLWFIIPGLPIAFHRLWNAALWIVPPILLGWLLARGLSRQPGLRLGAALWIGLFLSQGPIYAPLLLAASLLVACERSRPWLRGLSTVAASLYAGLSRWTWFGAAGAWGVLLELDPRRSSPRLPLLRRLRAAALIAMAGSLPGILVNWNRLVAPRQNNLAASQPLLWYRLFPNATLEMGILYGLLLASGPLILILAWLVISRRFKLDGLQLLAIGVVLTVTLVAGLVASVKIGGGSNLHNMDMFFITLAFIIMLYLDQITTLEEHHSSNAPARADLEEQQDGAPDSLMQAWPSWAKAALVAASLLLALPRFSDIRVLELPQNTLVRSSLDNLRQNIDRYKQEGEILFLDQRQLLTFGFVQNLPLVPEYEKKYLMDQAMAGNAAYFREFFDDLANKRFALIVSEPLFRSYDDEYVPFSEENNAWVRWVSKTVLCFYTPEKTYREVRVQLLVPRAGSLDCELPQP